MAEIKNTFLKGKMNKDLDSRLIQNGEYRDALNISVGKSENQSVGSLQNVLGNSILTKPTSTGTEPFESNTNLVCIGQFVDNDNNRVFQLLTDYTDPSPSSINLPDDTYEMKITVYDPNNTGNPYITLLSGSFLNFSTTNLVTGINLVEDLLFFTDNRNQPRKINVSKAILNSVDSGNPYYTLTDQISVAKYAPFKSPILYETLSPITTTLGSSSFGNGETLLFFNSAQVEAIGLEVGCQLINSSLGIDTSDFAIVTYIILSPTISTVHIAGDYTIPNNTSLVFKKTTMKNNALNSTYSGEENFLKDKFIRFSYRFKFDDNEYSLMAPFTQPVFIPNQKGFFINGDEDSTYRSTIVDFMENNINEVTLLIELPQVGSDLFNLYKIKSIDILYKESDSLAVKVIETVGVDRIELQTPSSNIYSYKYNSQKPYKTLQESETTRVYDKTPVRALAQEVSGNRVIYGNYINQNTPPSNLDYNVSAMEKSQIYESWIEYPNHTLKQNRTYQVGVVLADKFGRQSSVILSSATPYVNTGGFIYGASSIYVPYKNNDWTTDVKDWLGDTLALTFNKTIDSNKDTTEGTPGLYAIVSGSITGSSDGFQITAGTVTGNTYTLTLTGGTAQKNIPSIGNYLRGNHVDYVKITNVQVSPIIIPPTPLPSPPSGSYVITTDGDISDSYNYSGINPDIKFSYLLNELGWYSYKIVVKQQQQEYYNVYIPGMLAGYPVFQTSGASGSTSTVFPTGESDVTCHFVSINDNINKVPRDLSEVGPNQTQYRSSAKLWGRVENKILYDGSSYFAANKQYYPTTIPDTVSTIAPSNDLGFLQKDTVSNPLGSAYFNLYQLETSPLINRVSTSKRVGVIGNNSSGPGISNVSNAMSPFLGVYETSPVVSALDIFWETSTTGYVSDLNADILSGSDSIFGYTELDFSFNENQDYAGGGSTTGAFNSPWITAWFNFVDRTGSIVNSIDSVVFSVTNRSGQNLTSSFELFRDTTIGSPTYLKYRIKILNSDFYYGTNFATYGSFIFDFNIQHTVSGVIYTPTISTFYETLQISNSVPVITSPSTDNTPVYNLTNAPLIGPIIDMVGKNGSFSTIPTNYLSDLYWEYDPAPGDTTYYGLFSVNSSTGDVSVTNSNIPIGVYDLRLRLQDSSTSSGLMSTGGLWAYREVRLQVPDTSVGCSSWNSLSTDNGSGYYNNNTTGYINIWKMLRAGETIVSSNVRLSSWVQFTTMTVYSSTATVSFTGGNPTGYFNANLFNNNGFLARHPAETLFFTGTVYTSSGRVINISYGSNKDTIISGLNTSSSGCTVGSPTGYIPNTCREWTIYNNSSFPIPFNGLHGNGKTIIGGTIMPGQYAKSTGEGGIYPVTRYLSLQAAGTGTIGGVINYTSSVTCPL